MRKRIIVQPEPPETKRSENGQFQPGASGNPRGRPVGSRPKILAALDALGDAAALNLVHRLLHDALFSGSPSAMAILATRIWPERKGRPVELSLPEIKDIGDLQKANAAVTAAMARGELTPEEASVVAGVLNSQRTATEIAAIKEDLKDIRKQLDAKSR
jgi:hypothetical protein